MINKEVYIYSLSSSEKPEDIRYIGKTINKDNRLTQHVNEALYYNHDTYKNNWMKSQIKKGNEIIFSIIETCDETNWMEKEKFWIKEYKTKGYKLTNLTEGGETSSILGEKHPLYGKIGSNSPAFMIHRKEHLVKPLTRRVNKGKQVIAYNIDETFYKKYESVRKACEDLKCRKEPLTAVCRGVRKTYMGYIWEYINTTNQK